MRRNQVWKWIARLIAALAVIFLLILGAVILTWVFRAGLPAGITAMTRLLRNGPTQIDDFKYYPARILQASSSPYRFRESQERDRVPEAVDLGDGPRRSLEEILTGSDTIAFLVVKGDELVYESYFQGHSPEALSQSFSVSKSFTSALVGAALEDGYFQSVYQPVTDFVPELAGRGFENVTLDHLMTMTSGSGYVEDDNPFGVHILFNYTNDLKKMILNFQTTDLPGASFEYKSGDSALLALALERALGPMTLSEYMHSRIWEPLGMEHEGIWTVDREGGLEKSWCCLAASARDFAKFGRLYLRLGEWEGRQMLPVSWIERSTRQNGVHPDAWPDDYNAAGFWNYGYYWWLASQAEGDYLALGKDGQYIYVNPARDTVIVRLGWSQGELTTRHWLALFQYLARETRSGS